MMLTDAYGSEIKPGVRVVFNQSGYARFGRVVEIGPIRTEPNSWSGYVRRNIKIRPEYPSGGSWGLPAISRVTDTKNMVVLPERQ